MRKTSNRFLTISFYLFLSIVTFLAYSQTLKSQFIYLDDGLYVTENQNVTTGINFYNIKWAFTTNHAGNWHPLSWLSHMLDCQLFGLNPAGHHLTSLLLHIANSLLLFTLLNSMTNAFWQSAFVAAAFALHPLHVESVAWVAERKDVLSTFLWFLTVISYFHYTRRLSAACYLLTLVLFALGLMAKPMLVTLPFVLLLLDHWPLNRLDLMRLSLPDNRMTFYRSSCEKIPFFILSAVSSIITFFAQKAHQAVVDIADLPIRFRAANAIVSYVKYLGKTFYPKGLAVLYPYNGTDLFHPKVIAAFIFLLALSFLIIRLAKSRGYLLTGWLLFLGTLVPVIGLVQVGNQPLADRYTYVPIIGVFIIIAWAAADFSNKLPYRRIVLSVVAMMLLSVLSICTYFQAGYWRNNALLFGHTVTVTKNNSYAHNNFGSALLAAGKYNEAVNQFLEAIRIKPNYARAFNNLGSAYGHLNRTLEEIEAYKQAIRLEPDLAEAHYNLGCAYAKLERLTEAIDAYGQALKINPALAEAYNNLGNVYRKLNRTNEAIEAYKKALQLAPNLAAAHYNLGFTCLTTGDKSTALNEYQILRKLSPELAVRLLEAMSK